MRENKKKREGLAMGIYRKRKKLPKGVAWVKEGESAKILGVPIGNNMDYEAWWKKKIKAVQSKTQQFVGLFKASYRPYAERFPRVPARRMYFIPNVLFGSLVLLRAWAPAVCRLVCRFECPPSWVLRKIIASRSRTESDPATLVAHSVSDTSLSNVVAGGGFA